MSFSLRSTAAGAAAAGAAAAGAAAAVAAAAVAAAAGAAAAGAAAAGAGAAGTAAAARGPRALARGPPAPAAEPAGSWALLPAAWAALGTLTSWLLLRWTYAAAGGCAAAGAAGGGGARTWPPAAPAPPPEPALPGPWRACCCCCDASLVALDGGPAALPAWRQGTGCSDATRAHIRRAARPLRWPAAQRGGARPSADLQWPGPPSSTCASSCGRRPSLSLAGRGPPRHDRRAAHGNGPLPPLSSAALPSLFSAGTNATEPSGCPRWGLLAWLSGVGWRRGMHAVRASSRGEQPSAQVGASITRVMMLQCRACPGREAGALPFPVGPAAPRRCPAAALHQARARATRARCSKNLTQRPPAAAPARGPTPHSRAQRRGSGSIGRDFTCRCNNRSRRLG